MSDLSPESAPKRTFAAAFDPAKGWEEVNSRAPQMSPHLGLVPLICPTSQMVSLVSHTPATGLLLCMGLFSIFWLGARPGPALERQKLHAGSSGSSSVSERMMRSGLTVVSAGSPSPWTSIQIA